MKTLIIDNYDSFTYNLYQLVGEFGGNPEVVRNDRLTISDVKKGMYSHIVISPGPGDPSDKQYFGDCSDVIQIFDSRIPILGVCLGHQGIIYAFGGQIVRAKVIKHGKTSHIRHDGKGIFDGIKNPVKGMRYHSLVGKAGSLPSCLEITAESIDDGEIMGIRHKDYPIFGIQFHPESIGTDYGNLIIKNFLSV
ncbi:MAG: aminodeoxychorismate/anthranilate synthase component II [Patescibacteria group bacterium]|nr:aminodeoxychorismate/anthranilate synthase component II [Patescibacteria group bacterium]